MGYEVECILIADLNSWVGIIYLNTTKNDSDGGKQTEFWSSEGLSNLENQKIYRR